MRSEQLQLQRVRTVANQLACELQAADVSSHDPAVTLRIVHAAMEACLDALSSLSLWGPQNRTPSGELWRIAGPWLKAGSLQDRARQKPLGYAGDYILFSRIIQGDCCGHPLGNALDRFFQGQPAVEAVRLRTKQTADQLARRIAQQQGGSFRVVSIGAGPALDICRAVEITPPQLRAGIAVTLLDVDPAALDCAAENLATLLPAGSVTCLRTNLGRLHRRRPDTVLFRNVDFLNCPGLFDYLNDDTAVAMLRSFGDALAPGGEALIYNFATENPSRAYMEWIGNWYLEYRDAEGMRRIARECGELQHRVAAERSGVILGLTLHREG